MRIANGSRNNDAVRDSAWNNNGGDRPKRFTPLPPGNPLMPTRNIVVAQ